MKKIIRLVIIWLLTSILSIFIIWLGKYIHSKTLWYNNTDCMVEYINKYYPYWAVYNIEKWKYHHIDKRGITYFYDKNDIYGCYIKENTFFNTIANSTYCYITYFFEKKLKV